MGVQQLGRHRASPAVSTAPFAWWHAMHDRAYLHLLHHHLLCQGCCPPPHPHTHTHPPHPLPTHAHAHRLERDGDKLSKAQRYGQPNERLHYRSGLPPAIFEAVVCSYHHHGLRGTQPKVGGWSWELLQQHNASIDWAAWERDVLSGVLAG